MSFFMRKKNMRNITAKRKKSSNDINPVKKFKKAGKKNAVQDEELSSDEELGEHHAENHADQAENFSSDEEDPQEKRLRLAKQYIAEIENEEKEKKQLDDVKDIIGQRLKDEALDEIGRLQKKRAHEYEDIEPEILCTFRGHKLTITCVVVSSSENFLFSGSKDCSIIKWSIVEQKRVHTILGGKKGKEGCCHTDQVLCMALSSDDKFLVSGGRDKIINIWNPDSMNLLKTFRGHKNAITGLVFKRSSHELISASKDRSLKLWNLDEMGYIETLFGHQDEITNIDVFHGETVLTSGARDNSIRLWKIVEETQLVFQAFGSSQDCLCVSSHNCFISGGDDGSLLFWGIRKKKPMSKILLAHGEDPETEQPNWIVSLCALHNTDLVASGSKDGFIRLWRRDDRKNSLVPVSKIPMTGFVNSLQFTPSGNYLVAGIGQEHRFGRWWRYKNCKNSIVIYSWLKNKKT